MVDCSPLFKLRKPEIDKSNLQMQQEPLLKKRFVSSANSTSQEESIVQLSHISRRNLNISIENNIVEKRGDFHTISAKKEHFKHL